MNQLIRSTPGSSMFDPHQNDWSCVSALGSLPSKNDKHRLMLTGATGLLGREVYKAFMSSNRWTVCGLGLSRAKLPILTLDLFDSAEFCKYLDEFKPDVLIHCA